MFIHYRMVKTRRNRSGSGVVSRALSPVNEGLGLVTRTGSRVIRTGDSMWRSLGNGARGVFSNITDSLDTAGRRVLTGHRGGRRNRSNRNRSNRNRNRSNRNRKNRATRKNRASRKNRNRSNRNRKNRNRE